MTTLTVTHRTLYRYATPVEFGEHRLMFRPRDSHDLRLLDTNLTLSPPAAVRWQHDVFGNSIATARFSDMASELSLVSTFRARHYPLALQQVTVEPYAERYPFSYSAQDAADLGRTAERHYPDPEHQIDFWARHFVDSDAERNSLRILVAMTEAIHGEFSYRRRPEMGTQPPVETLATRSGTCRDYAVLMMEAARSLGLAARFVSGYLYDEKLISGGSETLVGTGETHAWVQIYLPGAGWVEFDPTNALIGGKNLIRVAVARDPAQAIPVSGTFIGPTNAFLGIDVSVEITAEPDNEASGEHQDAPWDADQPMAEMSTAT
jgi:transglutaminase-like putative cysteine protease